MPREKQIKNLWLFQFAADIAAIAAAYYTTVFLRFHSEWGEHLFASITRALGIRLLDLDAYEPFYIISAPRIIAELALLICLLYAVRDLYSGRRFLRPRPVGWNVLLANGIALVTIFTYFYLRRNTFHPRSILTPMIALNVVYCVCFRSLMDRLLAVLRERFGMDRHRALMVGEDGEGEFLRVLIDELHPHGIHIVERIGVEDDEPFDRLLGRIQTAAQEQAADVIITAAKRLTIAEIMQMLQLADEMDVCVKVLSDKMDVLVRQARLPVDLIHGMPLVHFDAPSQSKKVLRSRHLVSMVVAAAALILLAPLMTLIAVMIKLTSKGPLLFLQERIGVNRVPFTMFKFRTMHDRADELRAQLEEFNESSQGLFKMKRDPRVTAVGRVLRRFSLDELPQLFNVVKGEMTIVGPRPLPRSDFESYYEEWHYSRHSGMPGLTCLWQVSGRSDIDFHNMCILDVFYLRNQSWILDLRIVLKTIWVVVFAKGAY